MSHAERFWAKVNKTGDCWLWTAALHRNGYGAFRLNGKVALAHRVAYEIGKGPIPEGMQIDHVCHRRHCVRPDHLRAVTQKQNLENLTGGRNPSGLRGVSWRERDGKWQARVTHEGREYAAGYYLTAEEGAEAAKQLRLALFSHNDADRRTA